MLAPLLATINTTPLGTAPQDGFLQKPFTSLLSSSGSPTVRAAPVRGAVPDEEDRDRERTSVFGGEVDLVASACETPGEARHPFAVGRVGEREVAEKANPSLVDLPTAKDFELVDRPSLRSGDEHLLAVREHPIASARRLESGNAVSGSQLRARNPVQP